MLSALGNMNLMRKQVISGGGGGGIWMIGNSPSNGRINVSTNNGTSWTDYDSTLPIVYGITYGLTSSSTPLWVATGSGTIATSSDSGVTWSSVPSVSMTHTIFCAGYGKTVLELIYFWLADIAQVEILYFHQAMVLLGPE